MLTVELVEELLAPRGQAALALAQALNLRPENRLHALARLRKEFTPELAAVALETAVLRQRARAKFSRGDEMYWTREALEQASGEHVARHRTARYRSRGSVTDLCCSVGGDSLAFARSGVAVVGVDHDPIRLALARANAAVCGVQEQTRFVQGDVRLFAAEAESFLFFDPARRSGGRRAFDPADYQPPLTTIVPWLSVIRGLGVKVAPGIDYDALRSALSEPFEVELISVGGEVKEAVLWFGALRCVERSATLLPQGAVLAYEPVAPVAVRPPLRYLYEPDGAVIRAHLVEQLAHRLDAFQIDPKIAFLTSDSLQPTPFARAWEIREVMSFNLKQLRTRLRELQIGQVIVKKRGSPIDPQVLEKQLRLEGTQEITLVLTQAQGRPVVLLCDPASTDPSPVHTST